jgi:hypothetical protein
MSSMKRIALLTMALIMAPSLPAGAQASPYADLIAKGKRALNDFDYPTADGLWRQLLTQPLSRQRRIDVMQYLVATTYPDDKEHQNRDSAVALIRQLGTLGARRMHVKDVSWAGLDSLYASTVTDIPPSASRDSVADIMSLITDGYPSAEIAERVNLDCFTFAFEELDVAVQRVRSQAGLSDALKRTCSRLLVESDPPNADLTIGNRDFGQVPDRGQLRWVQPVASIELGVSKGATRVSKIVEFPQGRLLHAKFYLQRDTIAVPIVRTPEQVAEALHLYDRFRPSTPKPVEPVKPRKMGAFPTGLIWGLLAGGGGYAVGQFVSAAGCTVNETVPQGETWKVRGQRYTGGQSVNLGAGMPCVATLAGGSGFSMFLLSSIIKSSKNRGANAKYQVALKAYPTLLKEWDARERRTFAQRDPDVAQTIADERTRQQQAQAENASIRARNTNVPEPEITVRDFSYASSLGATVARPSGAEAISDVDIRVPAAAAANPEAVAVVIGNRDYQAGIPKSEYAVRDAKSMKRYLVDAFGFSEDRVIMDTNATLGRMSELFGGADASVSKLAELVGSKPAGSVDVFVFYSGHGGPEGTPKKRFLLPVDARSGRLRATAYPIDQLYKNLTALPARSVTVAIDAGFGNLSDLGSMLTNQSTIEVEVGTVGGANSLVLLATSGDQMPRWRKDQGHGLFTYFLLKGLQGSADANGDGTVSASEIETYVKSNVRTYASDRLSGAMQNPEVFTTNPNRPITVIKPGG